MISGLYGITVGNDPHVGVHVKSALEGGARVIQFRHKRTTENSLAVAEKIATLCRCYGATYIINDDVDLALAVEADGVHLGRLDLDIKSARKKIGDKIIGISCYNKLHLAIEAEQMSADYVAFGRFFTSATKPDAVKAQPELLVAGRKQLNIPIVAIGGITTSNAAILIQAGANAVAVIDGLFNQNNIKNKARAFSTLFG